MLAPTPDRLVLLGGQRRCDRQVREQRAGQHRRNLAVDEPVEDPERVALQVAVHGVVRRVPAGGVDDLDPLLEAACG